MDNATRKYSFYELMCINDANDIVIEIPKVQRDYVQGRDNEQARVVLSDLLKDIKKALNEETLPLQLQFVYGKEENKRFIPIDGQQRLTTLFLLHIYAFRNDKTKDEMLKRFSYETRPTSRDFLQKLVENRTELFKEMEEACISKQLEIEQSGNRTAKYKSIMKSIIVDAIWFNSLAIYDPTVQAAINALAMIYEEFNDYEELDKKLMDCENKKVVFHFLNMNNLGMEDSLYIKLNARGKQLTKFENFKASLFARLDNIKEYTLDEKNVILSKFDNSWTDIFWKLCQGLNDKNDSKEYFDIVFERFFQILLTNYGILTGKNEDILVISNPAIVEKINKDFFDMLIYLLDYLADLDNTKTSVYNDIYNRTIAILKEDFTYEDRVLFHMVVRFVDKAQGKVEENFEHYECWTRVIQNLVYNTTIDQDALRQKAVESINKLSNDWNDLYAYISAGNKIDFFETNQVIEEREKINIILAAEQQEGFVDAIYRTEKQQYFKGQIRSALYRAYDINQRCYDKDKFEAYWKVISLLFNEKAPNNGVNLCRALLCYGDYRLDVSSYKTLCVDSVNDSAGTPSMKTLFSMKNKEKQTKSDMIVSALIVDLLQKNIGSVSEADEALQDIINLKKNEIKQNDWRWCFVCYEDYNKLFAFAQRRRMRNDYGEELLIRNTSSSGWNPNVFLMVLGYKIGVDPTDSYYYPIRGVCYQHELLFRNNAENKWSKIIETKKGLCVGSDMIVLFSGDNMIDDAADYINSHLK